MDSNYRLISQKQIFTHITRAQNNIPLFKVNNIFGKDLFRFSWRNQQDQIHPELCNLINILKSIRSPLDNAFNCNGLQGVRLHLQEHQINFVLSNWNKIFLAHIPLEHHYKYWFHTDGKQCLCFETDCDLWWHLLREHQTNWSKSQYSDKPLSDLVVNIHIKKQSKLIAQNIAPAIPSPKNIISTPTW